MNSINPEADPVVRDLLDNGKSLADYAGLSKDALRVLYANAVGHYEAGRLEDAAAGLFHLVALDPHSEDYWALYGNTLMKLGDFANAVSAWEMALACAPRYATAAMIARTAIAIGQLDRAAEALVVARKYKQTTAQEAEFDALIESWYAARG